MKDLPIGFIDSGFGGLTVVKQSLKQLPNESIIYFGDQARNPYGPRPVDEVKQYIRQISHFLMAQGIKMLVIACNTATAAALEDIRAELPIPVVGVIHPGSRTAIKRTQNQIIGIIGTEGTIRSEMYERLLKEKDANIQVVSVPCPEFVPLVEKNELNTPHTWHQVRERLSQFDDTGIDTLVMGCTHYPLLRSIIQAIMGQEVYLVDSGVETINEVSTILDYFELSRTSKEALEKPATQRYYTTGDVQQFSDFVREWIEDPHPEVIGCYVEGETIYERTNYRDA